MRWLGWFACGVGYFLLSMSARAYSPPRVSNGQDRVKKREIEAGVHLLVLLGKLAGVNRSIQDYLENGPPDNVLMHVSMAQGIFRVFARIKGLSERQIVRGLDFLLVHDLFESVYPGGDRPKYDRSKLSHELEKRLRQLLKLSPPKGEGSKRSREARCRRYLPYMQQIVADLDPETRKWVLDRFRSYYLSESTEARLARECDRLSDVFLAAFYAGEGEKVQQFLDWATSRVRDSDLAVALTALKPYYTPEE